MPAFGAVFEVEQTAAAAARALDERAGRVPRWLIRPGSLTLIKVRMVLPDVEATSSLNAFDGVGGGTGMAENVAVTDRASLIETVQVASAPEQAPPQPVNVESLAGAAVSVTLVPLSYSAEQAEPQSTPAGDGATVPDPVPALDTLSAYFTAAAPPGATASPKTWLFVVVVTNELLAPVPSRLALPIVVAPLALSSLQ